MKPQRLDFIDYLRAWALIIMIEVHVVNCFMLPSLRNTMWFEILHFINGLVAPTFIFISGFSFIIATYGKRKELIQFSSTFFKRVSRIFLIVIIGYLIHIPYFSLKNIINYATPIEMNSFYNADVLQCIGSGLLLLLLLRMIIPSDRLYHGVITLYGLTVVIASPYIWTIDFSQWIPLPLACYCNELHGSFFPIFPWHGFLFLGAAYGIIYINIPSTKKKLFFTSSIIFAISIIICGTLTLHYLLKNQSFTIKPSPLFFITRYAMVITIMFIVQLYLSLKQKSHTLLITIGQESLLVYWLHLQIIYRHIWNGKSLEVIVNQQFGILESLMAFLALLSAMVVCALVWNKIKQNYPMVAKKIVIAIIMLGGVTFFLL